MDRFIDRRSRVKLNVRHRLKSNMDRFIVKSDNPIKSIIEKFKIQYG